MSLGQEIGNYLVKRAALDRADAQTAGPPRERSKALSNLQNEVFDALEAVSDPQLARDLHNTLDSGEPSGNRLADQIAKYHVENQKYEKALERVNRRGAGLTPREQYAEVSQAQSRMFDALERIDDQALASQIGQSVEAASGGGKKDAAPAEKKSGPGITRDEGGRFAPGGSGRKDMKNFATLTALGGYQATQSDGELVVHDVPIFCECTRDDMIFDADWIREAVKEAKLADREGYWPPMHTRHHEPGVEPRAAGVFRVKGTKTITMKGQPRLAVIADLIFRDPHTIGEVLARRFPYRSVEIFNVKKPKLDGLALLDHEAPFLELPMLEIAGVQPGPTRQKFGATNWHMDGTPDEAVLAHFRRGSTAHLLFREGSLNFFDESKVKRDKGKFAPKEGSGASESASEDEDGERPLKHLPMPSGKEFAQINRMHETSEKITALSQDLRAALDAGDKATVDQLSQQFDELENLLTDQNGGERPSFAEMAWVNRLGESSSKLVDISNQMREASESEPGGWDSEKVKALEAEFIKIEDVIRAQYAMKPKERAGLRRHSNFSGDGDMADTEDAKKEYDEDSVNMESDSDSEEREDMEADGGGTIDASAVIKAIEDGSISIADFDAIQAAMEARIGGEVEAEPEIEEPSEDEMPAPASIPARDAMRAQADPKLGAKMARMQGKIDALEAKQKELDAREAKRQAEQQRKDDVSVAMKRLSNRPLGDVEALETKLVNFHKSHGAKAFSEYVDGMAEAVPEWSGDPGKKMTFGRPIEASSSVAMKYQEHGPEAVTQAQRGADEWRQLHETGHTRKSEEQYVAAFMRRMGLSNGSANHG